MERTPNKSQRRQLTTEKKILPLLLPGFELATFRLRVRRSTNKLSRLPMKNSTSPVTTSTTPDASSAATATTAATVTTIHKFSLAVGYHGDRILGPLCGDPQSMKASLPENQSRSEYSLVCLACCQRFCF